MGTNQSYEFWSLIGGQVTTKQPSFVFDGSDQALIRVFQIWQGKVIKEPPASNKISERFLFEEKVSKGRGVINVKLS